MEILIPHTHPYTIVTTCIMAGGDHICRHCATAVVVRWSDWSTVGQFLMIHTFSDCISVAEECCNEEDAS